MKHEPVGPIEGETLTVDGVPIHFVRMGAGPAVVLIHGASGNLYDMTFDLAPALAHDHTVIAFDRPGHGFSGLPARAGTTLGTQAALMRGALNQAGIDRALVVGHSYGGSVALAWALDDPDSVAGLMLLAAPSQVWEGGLDISTDLLANPLTGPLLAHTLPALVTKSFAEKAAATVFEPQPVPADYIDHLRLDLVLSPRSLRANALQLDALKGEIRARVPSYPGLSMPVEILHGTADTTVPLEIHSEPLAEQVRQARLTRLDGIGHMVHQVALPDVLIAFERLEARAKADPPTRPAPAHAAE